MNKILVIYKSKYGASTRYTNWLKEKLNCDVFSLNTFNGSFDGYDRIILVGGIYAGGIAGLKYLKKHRNVLADKKVFIFAVGAGPYDEGTITKLKDQNLSKLSFHAKLFYGRGIYDEKKMNFIHRTMCRTLRKSLAKKDPSEFEPWMQTLVQATDEGYDWTDPKYLLPLIDAVNHLN